MPGRDANTARELYGCLSEAAERKLSQPNVEKEVTVGWPLSVPGRKPAVLRLEPPLSPRTG
jgi:hypothetical protein